MNIRKIVLEEINDFKWIQDTEKWVVLIGKLLTVLPKTDIGYPSLNFTPSTNTRSEVSCH
jgi:hypothetical protein